MVANGTASEATAVGRVVSVNEKGIRFEGYDTWCNFSKFAVGLIAPAKGDVVSVTFDRSGFVRAIAPADGSQVAQSPRSAPGATSGPQPSARETTITRLAVLKAAAEYAASKPESKSGDVLKIAASWERWILREPDAGDDLADAF